MPNITSFFALQWKLFTELIWRVVNFNMWSELRLRAEQEALWHTGKKGTVQCSQATLDNINPWLIFNDQEKRWHNYLFNRTYLKVSGRRLYWGGEESVSCSAYISFTNGFTD